MLIDNPMQICWSEIHIYIIPVTFTSSHLDIDTLRAKSSLPLLTGYEEACTRYWIHASHVNRLAWHCSPVKADASQLIIDVHATPTDTPGPTHLKNTFLDNNESKIQ